MDNTLPRLDCQCMCGQGNILCLLQRLRLQKCEARISNLGYGRVVGVTSGLQGDVDDNGKARKSVQVGHRGDEDGRARGDGDKFAISNWRED